MTAVSQLLPNFIQGINEQPDELKKPGQVRDAVNVYPDVTKGLCKRTGYEKVTDVTTTTTGTWFCLIRREGDQQKKYIFNVSRLGFVRGWDADTGTVQTIKSTDDVINLGAGDEAFDNLDTDDMSDALNDGLLYLQSESDYAIKTATLADTAFICNSGQTVRMDASKENKREYEAFIEFKVVDQERAYKINFDRVGEGINTFSQASKIDEGVDRNFFGGGNHGQVNNAQCNAVGTYNLQSSTATNSKYTGITGNRTAPIQLRVSITATPEILPNSLNYNCRYDHTAPILLSGGEGWQVGDTFTVDIPGTHGLLNKTMSIDYTVTEALTTSGQIDVPNISVTPTSNNNSLLDLQEKLADEIYSRINTFDSSFTRENVEIVGNGIYIYDSKPFKIDTSEPDLLNVISTQSEYDLDWEEKREADKTIFLEQNPTLTETDFYTENPEVIYKYPNPYAVLNNVSGLPLECKQGFIVKVANSFVEDDDYFVQFVRDFNDLVTLKPELPPTVNIVSASNYIITTTDGTFDWSTVNSNLSLNSSVGTEFTATSNGTATGNNSVTIVPTFVESGMGYWKEIAKPGERATMSRSTLPHILRYRSSSSDWIIAKVAYAARTCGTEDQFTPSFIDKKINNILFYRNRLVFLSGSSVVTSNAGDFTNFFPSTALTVSPSDPVDVEATSNYTANLYSGIQVNNALLIFGEYNQFLLTTDSDIFSPNTAKLSQVSSYKFDINSEPFVISTNVGFLGSTENSSLMYEMTNIFREGQTDVVEKSKPISNSFASGYSMISSSKESGLITFGKKGSDVIWLYKYFKENSQNDLQQAWFKWKLPSNVSFQFIDGNKHYAITDDGDLLCNDLESNIYQDDDVDFEMKIELPRFYVLKNEQQSFRADTTASLVIHRMHLNTGETNFYDITIERYAKDPYTIARDPSVMRYEQAIADAYIADAAPITLLREETVPLYEKNTNLDITITSTFNGPFTLYSLRWEGDYNNRYYQRV